MVMMRRIQRSEFGVELRVVVNMHCLLLVFRRIQRILVKGRDRNPRDAFPIEACGRSPSPFWAKGSGINPDQKFCFQNVESLAAPFDVKPLIAALSRRLI